MSLDFPNIIPECYVDTNLIEYLMHGTVNHQHSCNNVVRTIKSVFKDRFAVGIIDKDKKEVGYLGECEAIASGPHLCVLKHRQKPHYLITVAPAADSFLLDCAQEQGIHPEDFGISSKLEEFLKQTKRVSLNRDPEIRRLIEAISNNQEIILLQRTLKYLQEKAFSSSVAEIQAFFENPS